LGVATAPAAMKRTRGDPAASAPASRLPARRPDLESATPDALGVVGLLSGRTIPHVAKRLYAFAEATERSSRCRRSGLVAIARDPPPRRAVHPLSLVYGRVAASHRRSTISAPHRAGPTAYGYAHRIMRFPSSVGLQQATLAQERRVGRGDAGLVPHNGGLTRDGAEVRFGHLVRRNPRAS
jgi:hypothetical protein